VFDFLFRKKYIKVLQVFYQNDYYYVKLEKGSYEMIYRAARGVYWDEASSCLYFKGITTRENALRIIAEAINDEYGITLVFN
jgi:phage terminase large subunit-like protein